MSYLRFEDQADGVHVFFSDVTDSGPYYTLATFNETDIATLSRTAGSHDRLFDPLHSRPGQRRGQRSPSTALVKATGTTWEDYYRYDNENQGSGVSPPTTSTLLVPRGRRCEHGDAGNGFLVDNLSYAQPPAHVHARLASSVTAST